MSVCALGTLSDDRARICVKACPTRFYSHRRYEDNNIGTSNKYNNNENDINWSLLLLVLCPFPSLSCSLGFIRFVLPGVTQCLLDLGP